MRVLSSEESTERIAEYFAKISQEFPRLHREQLPDHVKTKIDSTVNPDELPDIQDYVVYANIKRSKKVLCPRGIGAKRGGTREQCSQKLFELPEIFGKIIKIFITNEYILCKIKENS